MVACLLFYLTDLSVADAASTAGEIPNANGLVNVNLTCAVGDLPASGGRGNFTFLCSAGSMCLDGDLGVYCQCYVRESTLKEVSVGCWAR